MKKIISVLCAGVVGTVAITNHNEQCLDNACSQMIYRKDLTEFKTEDLIKSISFYSNVSTLELPSYKDYCMQGILYYGDTLKSFKDYVGIENPEYTSVSGKENIKTKVQIGSEENPLNMEWADLALEITWCTGSSIELYQLEATTITNKTIVIEDGVFYSASIDEIEDVKNNNHMPFSGDFTVTSTYNEDRGWYLHGGMDLVSLTDDKTIYAIQSGVVEYSDWEDPYDWSVGFGKYVKIVGDDGRNYYYGHMSELGVEVGQRVEVGQPIGIQGTTGESTGEHLHIEARDCYGNKLDISEILGIANEYGDVNVAPVVTEDYSLEKKAFSLNAVFESNQTWNAIRPDDSGAYAIGAIQWRGVNARSLLQRIYNDNPDKFEEMQHKYGIDMITMLSYGDSYWESHCTYKDSNEYNFLKELLSQEWAIESQKNFGIEWEKNLIDWGKECGITDEKVLILYTRSCNYGAYTNSSSNLRNYAPSNLSEASSCVDFLKSTETINLIDSENYDIMF